VDRRDRTLALRSFLLATALSFAGSQQSWSLGPGGGGGGAPAPVSSAAVALPEATVTLTLLQESNSISLFLNPTFQTGMTYRGSQFIQNANTFQNILSNNPQLIKSLITNNTSNDGRMAKSVLRVLNALINGNTAKAESLWDGDSLLPGYLGFGSWSSTIVGEAAANGVTIYTMVASIADYLFGNIYEKQNPATSLNPFDYASRESNPSSAVAFTDEPPAGFPDDIALAYASALGRSRVPAALPFVPGWTAWASGYGGYNRTNGDPAAGSSTLTARLYGSVVGLDYHVTPQTLLGISLGGSGLNWNQSPGSGNGNALQIGVHGTTHFGAAYVSGMLDASTNWFNATSFAAGDELAAKFNAQSYGGRLEGGYRYAVAPSSGVAPYAAVQLQYFHTPSYSETDLSGGGLGANYGATDGTDTRSELGARFDTLQIIANMPVVLRAGVAWAHDWLSNGSVTTAFQIAPGSSFIVNSTALVPSDSALASLEAEVRLNSNWSLAAKFDGQFASSSQTYLGTGTLRYSW
jgi:outer membrane autotransporter protein